MSYKNAKGNSLRWANRDNWWHCDWMRVGMKLGHWEGLRWRGKMKLGDGGIVITCLEAGVSGDDLLY